MRVFDRYYRKKFLKMRHNFKDKMRENGRLYEEEHHSARIARRLQEQNEYVNPYYNHSTDLFVLLVAVNFLISSST